MFLPLAISLASYFMASLNYNQENSFDLYLANFFFFPSTSRERSLQLFKALFLTTGQEKCFSQQLPSFIIFVLDLQTDALISPVILIYL